MEKEKLSKHQKKGNPIVGLIIIIAVMFFAIKSCMPSDKKTSGKEDLSKVASAVFERTNFEKTNDYVNVSFVIKSDLSVNSAKASYYEDILKYISKIHLNNELNAIDVFQFTGYGRFVDKYGNKSEKIAIIGQIKTSEIKKINYENFYYPQLEKIIEVNYIHPGFTE